MKKYRKRNFIAEAFVAHRKEMRESTAWRYLPDNARRVLDRLELEHMRHGGASNGKLPCTYSNFEEAGVRRASIALALRQCRALGFLECTRPGWCSVSEFRTPSLYRLTYVHGCKDSPAQTDEWRQITSVEHAVAALRSAKPPADRGQYRWESLAEIIDSRRASAPRTVDAPARPMKRALVTR